MKIEDLDERPTLNIELSTSNEETPKAGKYSEIKIGLQWISK